MADIGLGLSFYAYLLFTVSMTITLLYVDKYQLNLLLDDEVKEEHKPINPHHSIQTTWALLFTSVLLYIPANILPIMHTNVLGAEQPSTILGGIVLLWKMESYPIAIIIFIASLFVPAPKIVILCWLNFSVQARHRHASIYIYERCRLTKNLHRRSVSRQIPTSDQDSIFTPPKNLKCTS